MKEYFNIKRKLFSIIFKNLMLLLAGGITWTSFVSLCLEHELICIGTKNVQELHNSELFYADILEIQGTSYGLTGPIGGNLI